MLKKVVALCIVAGCILFVGLLPSVILASAPEVPVIIPQVEEYLPRVYCTGIVQAEATYDLVSSGIYQVREVYCQTGEQVKKGQILAVLDNVTSKNPFFFRHSCENKFEISHQLSMLAGQYGINPEELATSNIDFPINTPASSQSKQESLEVQAPLEGIVIGDFPNPGTTVTNGMILCNVQSLSYIVKANLSEGDVDRVSVGDLAIISGEGIGASVCQGVVARISPTSKQILMGMVPQTVVEAEIHITEIPDELRHGYRVAVEIDLQKKRHLLTLPYEAINQDDLNREYVYIASRDGLKKRVITTGLEMIDGVEILDGIAPNEVIAVLGGMDVPKEKSIYRMKGE